MANAYSQYPKAQEEIDKEKSAGGRSTAEAVDNTEDPTGLDDISSEMEAESESGSELELESESEWEPEGELWDLNPHDYPTTASLHSDCIYGPHDIVCR